MMYSVIVSKKVLEYNQISWLQHRGRKMFAKVELKIRKNNLKKITVNMSSVFQGILMEMLEVDLQDLLEIKKMEMKEKVSYKRELQKKVKLFKEELVWVLD